MTANTSAADINKAVGDYANIKSLEAGARGDTQTSAAWDEGGAYRVLLHGLVGAVQGLSSGNVADTAIGTATVAEILPSIDTYLKGAGIGEDQRNALETMIAAGVGVTASSEAGGSAVAQLNSAINSANEDKFNRQLHIDEIHYLEQEAPALAAEEGISTADALKKLAGGLVYYTDSNWHDVEGANGPDATTLKYLGMALAPVASLYDRQSGDVPVVPQGQYTPTQTEALLQSYSKNNVDYYSYKTNSQFILTPDLASYEEAEFYRQNLDFSNGIFSSIANGLGGGVVGTAIGAGNLIGGVFTLGGSLLTAPGATLSNISKGVGGSLLDPAGVYNNYTDQRDTASVQKFLSILQGTDYEQGKITGAQNFADAIALTPTGRLEEAASLAAKAGMAEVDLDARAVAQNLTSGDTKVVGTNAPAANDAIFTATEGEGDGAKGPSATVGSADFYVTPQGTTVPATGYRAVGGPAVEEALTGTIAPRNPTYITFDNIENMTPSEAQSLLQLPRTPTNWVSFDTLPLVNDLKTPTGKWNTTTTLEPITNTFPEWGAGGGTQAITNQPIKVKDFGTFPEGGGK